MTTNIMFLRDMKTTNMMTKREMNERRGLSTMLAKAMLLILLFLAGGITNQAWGADYWYRYIIVNKSGVVATWCTVRQAEGSSPAVPDRIKTPLLPNSNQYHCYLLDNTTVTQDKSQGLTTYTLHEKTGWGVSSWNASDNFAVGLFSKSSSATEVTSLPAADTNIYVFCDDYHNDVTIGSAVIDLSGNQVYSIKSNNGYVYPNGSGDNARLKCGSTQSDIVMDQNYQWTLKSDLNDPYDIYIYSLQYPTHSIYTSTTNGSGAREAWCGSSSTNATNNPGNYLNSHYLFGEDNGKVKIRGTRMVGEYKRNDTTFDPQYAYLFWDNNNTCVNYNKTWDINGASNVNANYNFELAEVHVYTFHLINHEGGEVLSYTKLASSLSDAVTLYAQLKSTHAKDFSIYASATASTAISAAKSNDNSSEAYIGAEGTATYSQLPTGITDIYIGYSTNTTLDLSGGKLYSICRSGHESESWYMYTDASANMHPCKGTYQDNDRMFVWRLYNDDPYNITIRSDYHGSGYYLSTQKGAFANGDQFKVWSNSSSTAVTNWSLIADGCLVAFGTDSGNKYAGVGDNGYTYTNNNTAYTSETGLANITKCQAMTFTERTLSTQITYRIVNRSGKQALLDIDGYYSGKPSLPDAYRSPLVSQYHYWTATGVTDDRTTKQVSGLTEEIVDGKVGGADYEPAEHAIIYVTYDYDASNSVTFDGGTYHVDLTGQTRYAIKKYNRKNYTYLTNTSNTSTLGDYTYRSMTVNGPTTLPSVITDNYAFTLEGRDKSKPDPYDIVVRLCVSDPDLSGYFLTVQSAGDTDNTSGIGLGVLQDGFANDNTCIKTWMLLTGNKFITEINPYYGGGTRMYYIDESYVKPVYMENIATHTGSVVELQPFITYHIVNRGDNGEGTTGRKDAMRIYTPYSVGATIGFDAQYKSPLATNWQYFGPAEVSQSGEVYSSIAATPTLSEGDAVTESLLHLYCTYEYHAGAAIIKLDKSKSYNIKLNDRYFRSRGYSGTGDRSENFSSDAYSYTVDGDGNITVNGSLDVTNSQLRWMLGGNDPYAVKVCPTNTGSIDAILAQFEPGGNTKYTRFVRDGQTAFVTPSDRFIILSNENAANGKGNYEFMAVRPSGLVHDDRRMLSFSGSDYPYFGTPASSLEYQADIVVNKRTYTYNIVDNSGRIAIKCSEEQVADNSLTGDYGHAAIPTAIYSPYLKDETLTFYAFDGDYSAEKLTAGNIITATPYDYDNIYVRYTTDHLTDFALHLGSSHSFDMRANGHYVYDNNNAIAHKATVTEAEKDDQKYLWYVKGSDPYAVQIENLGDKKYLTFNTGTKAVTLSPTLTDNSYFILMDVPRLADVSGDDIPALLMAASGGDAVSAAYRLGRPADGDVRLYATADNPTAAETRFVFNVASLHVSYCLVDKSGKVILEIPADDASEKHFPDAWRSPLATNYRYWKRENFTLTGDTYTLKSDQTEIESLGEAVDGKVYVTYDASDLIDLDGHTRREADGKMYLLKFANGSSYVQEDGHDGFRPSATKAVYPYNNGEANLYVYGEEQWTEQEGAAASTRTRWAWYFDSDNNDPYRVRVVSFQTQASSNGYLRTYQPDGYDQVVTGIITTNSTVTERNAADLPTEYMILGTEGAYRLLTTDDIGGQRQTVTSFEQYWKNNPTALNLLLEAKGVTAGSDEAKAYAEQLNSRDLNAEEVSVLEAKGWHHYKAWANINSWTSTSTKTYQYTDHWFQTFSMGDGTFDIVEVNLDGVLILLDNHGWEIMRKPMAKKGSSNYDERQSAIKVYDSPMVKQYHFQYNYSKVPGYHKYAPTTAAEKASDNVQEVGTGSSLADYTLFESKLSNNGTLRDVYVTYDVKEAYADSYQGAATQAATKTLRAFLIREGNLLAKATNGAASRAAPGSGNAISSVDVSSTGLESGTAIGLDDETLQWYFKPNFNIDAEMGYQYGGTNDEKSKDETEQDYYDEGRNGFDPYNMQIQSKVYGTYFTTNAESAALDATSSMTAAYSGSKTVTLTDANETATGAGHDNTTLSMTNTTFMAIQDANGNLRLMPRFDHQNVVTSFSTLAPQNAPQPVEDTQNAQTNILLLPNIYTYIIKDHQGREALRYSTVGDAEPATLAKFRSPLAKDFSFYSDADCTTPLTSFVNITSPATVYVRYAYDDAADTQGLLRGSWVTTQINGADVQYNASAVTSGTKDASAAQWQWRLLPSAADTPDPYAVSLYNASVKTDGTLTAVSVNSQARFALLSHNGTADAYAFAVAGTGSTTEYTFLSGSSPATTTTVASFATAPTPSSAFADNTDKVVFTTDVMPTTVTYKIITTSGKVALQGTVTWTEAQTLSTDHQPVLPEWMRSPLMKPTAYTFYSVATGSDATGYTVAPASETTSLSTGEDPTNSVLFVRYQYNADTRSSVAYGNGRTKSLPYVDLSGTLIYRLQNYEYYWDNKASSDGYVENQHDVEHRNGLQYSAWRLFGDDPYEVRIVHMLTGRQMVVATPETAGTNTSYKNMTVYAPGNIPADYNATFMVLNGRTNTDALDLYVTGNDRLFVRNEGNGGNHRAYLSQYSYESIVKGTNTREVGDESVRFQLSPALAYHVVNNAGEIAISTLSLSDETTLTPPQSIMSPLLRDEDFTYYTAATETDGLYTVDAGSQVASGTDIATLTAALGHCDIYMRYTYDRENSPYRFYDSADEGETEQSTLDLSGGTWYNMGNYVRGNGYGTQAEDGKTSIRGAMVYANSETKFERTNDFKGTPNFTSLSDKKLLWRIDGNDPYAMRLYNCSTGNKVLTANGTALSLAEIGAEGRQTFMLLRSDCAGNADDATFTYRKYRLSFLFVTGDNTPYTVANMLNSKVTENTWNTKNSHTSDTDEDTRTILTGIGDIGDAFVEFFKAPVARKYRYHAVRYEGGVKKGETWTAVLEHDWLTPVVLEDQLSRLYAKYEQEYMTSGAVKAGIFKTRAELETLTNAQFYSNAAMTERVSGTTDGVTTYDVYPAIDQDKVYDIYFKYQPMTNAEIAALTGDAKTNFRWTTASQIADDVTYYKANGQLDEKHMTSDGHANWYFMVLDTDEGITATGSGDSRTFTGNQYFLRRQDNGNVGWLSGLRALHKETEDNLNDYTYSRLAESSRDSEHAPFREARWLWAFVGDDPYDAKLINFESALGINAKYDDDFMAGAENCYTRFSTVTTTDDKTGVTTTTYPLSVPTSQPDAADHPYHQWGLTAGYGSERTFSLLSTTPTTTMDEQTVNLPLYWQMTADSVTLQPRAALRQNAMQLLPYEPVKYEDVNLVIRRDDEVAQYTSLYRTPLASATGDQKTTQLNYLGNTMKTGISRMFYAAEDRIFVAGDKITAANIPVEVKRQFCTYVTYSDDYRNVGDATISAGPYRYEQTGYNADNEPVYNYKHNATDDRETPVDLPQSFYVKYHVNSDIFLTENAFSGMNDAEIEAEVARMADKNDHVYFLDFTDNLAEEGYNLGYHAYFDEQGSMRSQLPDEWISSGNVERKVWDDDKGQYVPDTSNPYNDWQYQTTTNRMTTVPEKLKWYFVGDPYNVQVFCTKRPGCNLARFNEEESLFQFIADCVHLRASDDVNHIDNREKIDEYKAGLGVGSAPVPTGNKMRNPNYGKPVYGSFYWEMVPAATTREGTFALRFRASNTLLGLNKVYYYLTHDGTKRSYYNATAETTETFNVNLNYDKNNTYSNDYEGLHKANNAQAAIHLVQPAKVYVTAYPKEQTTPKVIDELSEYFGVGETLTDVPRHLKRKYTAYSNLRYISSGKTLSTADDYNAVGGNAASFPLTLTTDKAYRIGDCNTVHPVGDTTTPKYNKVFVSGAKTNADFRLWVDYELDDTGKKLFTTSTDDYHWNDLLVSDWQGKDNAAASSWMYYDKAKAADQSTTHTDLGKWRITAFSEASVSSSGSGWNTGVKGLHWAFVGDAYSFKMVNRRQHDNQSNPCDGISDNNYPYVGTANVNLPADNAYKDAYKAYLRLRQTDTQGADLGTGNGNTDWGFAYCKTGGDAQVMLRTASLKTTLGDVANGLPGNKTNDFHYVEWQRRHYKESADGSTGTVDSKDNTDVLVADFLLTPFSLDTLTNRIDQMQPATADVADGDSGLNDCFDAQVEVRDANGVRRAYLAEAEMRYTDKAKCISVTDVMPQSLKRYGCTYKAYINYNAETKTGTEIEEFTKETLAEASGDCRKQITYVYTVDKEMEQFFTSPDDARNEEYTWASGYYRWDRTITGRVQYYETETYIADYVYNSAGRVEGYIYGQREIPKWSNGSSTTVTSNGWLNTHSGSEQAYGDDHQQNDNDNDQKWAYVGDPYSFTLVNYTKYLQNATAALYYDSDNGSIDFSLTQSSRWALVPAKDGKYYLALIDSDTGNIRHYVTFDRGENTDLAADKQFLFANGALPTDDPTGNMLGLNSSKAFYLATLNSYAAFVIYHLVMAHKHSADYEDQFEDVNFPANDYATAEARKTAMQTKIRRQMAEWLKYHKPDAYSTYCEDKSTLSTPSAAFDYADARCEGTDKAYITDDFKDGYVADGRLTDEAKAAIAPLMVSGSLRDLVTYPVENYTVEKVGIGNVLSLPWYMKRQFCKYTLRQRDVLRSNTNLDDPIVVTKDGVQCYVWMNDNLGVADTLAIGKEKSSPWYRVCNVKWESVTQYDGSNEDTQKDKETVKSENSHIITKLNKTHQNRMVLVDVVYEVDPDQFRFSDKGRNTTKWYSMMTNNAQDGLMNFSYKDGIGARPDRTQHYTNNYLWAPVGDPYGFVLHNRYATLNGTGWDNVVVTTTGVLPDDAATTDIKHVVDDDGKAIEISAKPTTVQTEKATYTGALADARFVEKRIVHLSRGGVRTQYPEDDPQHDVKTNGAHNAVYEMFVGNYAQAFLMHPTSAYVNTAGDKFASFYMVHQPQTATSQLEYSADVNTLRNAPDANWRLITTPEQLLPYFDRSGYVGGLSTTVASRTQNRSYYSKLQEFQSVWANNSRDLSGLPSDYFTVTDAIRDLVYGGKFYARTSGGSYETTEYTYDKARPAGAESFKLPLKFVPDNLIPMQQGYYRLVAFSQNGLDADAENAFGKNEHGIQGPRYISGYRHESEMTKAGYNSSGTLEDGSRWLHFYETDEEHTTFQTFSELNAKIGTLDVHHDRSITPHPALRGNIEILPAEYDPSSIFYFTPAADGYDRYHFGTQGLRVRGRAGGVQPGIGDNNKYADIIDVDPTGYGMTKLVKPDATAETGFDDRFRMQDIGGAAVTLRLLETEPTGTNWDEIVGDNLKNNSLCIDANHRYRVTIHKNNEMMEIGDTYDATEGHWTGLGIQDTKWLLQPVGTKTQWPYNEVPLRLEVQQGDKKSGTDSEGNDVYNWYASLYVPFDTRLSNTTDAAFTLDQAPKPLGETDDKDGNQSMTLRSLALLNNMGNPQFIPAGWPVIVRSTNPKVSAVPSVNGKADEKRHYVELYLPNASPTDIPESKAKIKDAGLRGSYLERSLTADDVPGLAMSGDYPLSATNTVMVFGQPFAEGTGEAPTEKGTEAQAWYTHTADAPGFYTNENWWRGHYGTTQVTATANAGTLKTAFLANSHGDETATKQQRSNTYVYHNKVFLVYEASATDAPRYVRTRFSDTDDDSDGDDDRSIADDMSNKAPWPCDVYDLQGRKVATNETPSTLRRNHPGLSKGVYIFGGYKVIVK